MLYALQTQTLTNPSTPGQVLHDILALVGGLTTAGTALSPNVAAATIWLALGTGTQAFSGGLTALANEIVRVPVVAVTGSGLDALATAALGVALGNGWLSELGAFGGTASAVAGSGTLYAYVPITFYLKTGAKLTVVQWSAT
jgi:hypothetical protein